MLRLFKNSVWAVLAWWLDRLAFLIRRQPATGGAAAWRAVHFSYSHFGEDLVILHLLRDRLNGARGCYVDVGAFDPILHSNTYLLYQYGWRGLNIDASTTRLAQFRHKRPGDVNALAAVSDGSHDVLFLEYPTPGTNRVVPPDTTDQKNSIGEAPTSITARRTQTLSEIIETQLPGTTAIDFLNIDCEGLDLAVLKGLDWSRWTPRVIAIEANTYADRVKIQDYLHSQGYSLVSSHLVTLIFLHQSGRGAAPAENWQS